MKQYKFIKAQIGYGGETTELESQLNNFAESGWTLQQTQACSTAGGIPVFIICTLVRDAKLANLE